MRRLVALTAAALPLIAQGAEWQTVYRAQSGTEYAIDKASVLAVSADGQLVEAWDRAKLPHPRGWKQLEGRLINNARRYALHDCVRHRVEVIEFKVYFNDWLVEELHDIPRWLTAPLDVLPDSAGEALHRAACAAGAAPAR